jgi:hypothetical protein
MNDSSYVRTTNSSNKIRQSQRQKRQTATVNSRGSTPELNNSNLMHRQRRTRVNSGYKQRKLSQSRLGSSITRNNNNNNNKRGYTNRNNSLRRRSPANPRMMIRSNNSMTKRYSTRTKGVVIYIKKITKHI